MSTFGALLAVVPGDTPLSRWVHAHLREIRNAAVAADLAYERRAFEPGLDAAETYRTEREAARTAGYRSDIPWSVAAASHAGTSHVPEQRAQQELDSYQQWLEHARATLDKTGADAAEIERVFAEYRASYRSKFVAYLSAKGQTVSTMITGRSNFNVSRAQKKSDSADRRTSELLDWRVKALNAAVGELTRAARDASFEEKPESVRLQEELDRYDDAAVRGAGFTKFVEKRRTAMKAAIAAAKAREARATRAPSDSTSDIAAKLAEKERLQETYKAVNVIARKKVSDDEKVRLMGEIGVSEHTARGFLKPDYGGRVGVPSYVLQNNNAEIKRLQGRLEEVTARQTAEDAEYTFDARGDFPAGEVAIDTGDDRLRVTFGTRIPSAAHDAMRSGGFVYSPSNKAYQRKLTDNAIASANRLFGLAIPYMQA